jgi:hypothetical protein
MIRGCSGKNAAVADGRPITNAQSSELNRKPGRMASHFELSFAEPISEPVAKRNILIWAFGRTNLKSEEECQ